MSDSQFLQVFTPAEDVCIDGCTHIASSSGEWSGSLRDGRPYPYVASSPLARLQLVLLLPEAACETGLLQTGEELF